MSVFFVASASRLSDEMEAKTAEKGDFFFLKKSERICRSIFAMFLFLALSVLLPIGAADGLASML